MTKPDVARVEWIVAVPALAVALMLGVLVLDAIRGGGEAPDLAVARRSAAAETARLDFVVRNEGGRAARDVTVALRLRGPEGTEIRTLTIDFVPARSEVAGAFLLDGAAGPLEPDLRVESYLDP